MEQFVKDLEMLRQSFKIDKVNLLGHSFGGLLAMYYASTHSSNVQSLILLDSDAASWQLRTPYQHAKIAERTTELDQEEKSQVRKKENWQKYPELVMKMWKIVLRTYFFDRKLADSLHLEFDNHSLRNLELTSRHVRKDLGKYDIHDRLKSIIAPTLIIHGSESIFSVEGAMSIHKSLPNSKLVILENVGHFAYIEDPIKFVQTVNSFMSIK
jgi:proline iminopeptidase